MPTANEQAWEDMKSKLKAMGVGSVEIGEPRSAVQSGMVAIIPQDGEIDEVTLNSWREVHAVVLRRYEGVEQEPGEGVEKVLEAWRAAILADIFGDFDLGGTIAYALPAQTNWVYDADRLGNHDFRTLDVFIVYRIDPTAGFAQ